MAFRLIALCILSLFSLWGDEPSFLEGAVPSWVKPCHVQVDSVVLKSAQTHLQHLLIDTQRNWEEEAYYVHIAMKANSLLGVNGISRVDIPFAPSVEDVMVHFIRVYRNGEWIDKMRSRHKVLHRELALESGIYYGVHNLIFFLDDVREGDILEFAYTSVGEMPFFSTHMTDILPMQSSVETDRLFRRIVAKPEHRFALKKFNTDKEAQINDLPSGLKEWEWDIPNAESCPNEDRQPSWYFPLAMVQMSEYPTWQDVAEKLAQLYVLPSDPPTPEMAALLASWNGTQEERAIQALRFVQDEIRYLGFEEDIWGFKPSAPGEVLRRRYGDCKDKTFLLHALLHYMEIGSTPCVVNSSRGKLIPEWLPSPFVFDHIMLQIQLGNEVYWVDPTISHQGGASLKDNYFPHTYLWGVLLKQGGGLVELPTAFEDRPIEIQTSFIVQSNELSEMRTTRTFHGMMADFARRYLRWVGIAAFSDMVLNNYNKIYGSAAFISPPSIQDDREKNVLVLTEGFSIPTLNRTDKKVLKVFSHAVADFLDSWLSPQRNAPYALFFPHWAQEHIHVENPFEFYGVESTEVRFRVGSFHYSRAMIKSGNVIDMFYELKHLRDHVPVEEVQEYWDTVKQVEQDIFFQIAVN